MGFSRLYKTKPSLVGVGVPEDARHLLSFATATGEGRKVTFKLRSSGLPFCPRAYSILTQMKPDLTQVDSAIGDLTLQTGHTVHAILQKWLGRTGVLFGNWKCHVCGYFVEWANGPQKCRNKNCEHHRQLLEYVEVDMVDPATGCTGHIDGLRLVDGGIEGIEIKTTSQDKLDELLEPIEQHEFFQAPTYAYLFNRQHSKRVGHKLRYFTFIYISKNLPYSFTVKYQASPDSDFGLVAQSYSGKRLLLKAFRRKVNLRRIRRYFKQVESVLDTQEKNPGRLFPRKGVASCTSPHSQQARYCPVVRVCFGEAEKVPTIRKLPVLKDPYTL